MIQQATTSRTVHISATTTNRPVTETLRRFKMRKREFEQRLAAVREERDDLRHLVCIPVNPRSRQNPMLDAEKDSRLVEVFQKVDAGHYASPEVTEELTERLLSRLWDVNL